MRIFLLLCLVVLTGAQALGRTHLTADSPEVNSENLLVLLAPLVCLYGAGTYWLLLEHLNLPFPQLRHLVTGVFVLLFCAPLVFRLLPPPESPLAYPPYYPPWVQQFGRWMNEEELVMSDMPWAIAWYGKRQSVWTTLNVRDMKGHDDFFAIHESRTWGKFVVDSLMTTNDLPAGFPLRCSPNGPFLSEGHFFLTDWPRWKTASEQTR